MAQLMFVALNLFVYAAIAISAVMWAVFFLQRLGVVPSELAFADPRIPLVVRRHPFWTAADFLVMFGTFVLVGSAIGMLFVSKGWLPKPIPVSPGDEAIVRVMETSELYARTWVGVITSMVSIGVALGFTLLSQLNKRDALRQLGLHPTKETLMQGLWGSLWMIPPVLVVSLLVSTLIPYQHPVLDTLAAIVSQRDVLGFFVIFVSTAIITPMAEEFMFRVLFQGGLQGMIDRPVSASNDTFESEAADWQSRSWWPILLTSVLFAGMHVGQGAAPIPLFFLSIGLGYLYRQTGSIVPPLVVHMVLNGTTTIVEFTRLLST